MKRFMRILKRIGIVLIVIIVGFVLFVYARADRKYKAPYPEIKASPDSAMIARGEYLIYGPAHCAACHTPVTEFSRMIVGEKVPLSGGSDFVLPPGIVHAPNITPDEETGIGTFTDGEIARILRYGVKRDGSPVLDFMPFYHLNDEDLTAIVSYLRSINPVKNKRPENEWNFLGKAILAFGMIKPMGDGIIPVTPVRDSTAAYGKYLAESVANCKGCHTQRDMMTGAYVGTPYAGNQPFEVFDEKGNIIKGKHFVTPNLTPETETGRIAVWPQEVFIARFRAGAVIPGTPMPWGSYKNMTDADLAAIYKYLHSLEPVKMSTPVGILDGDPE